MTIIFKTGDYEPKDDPDLEGLTDGEKEVWTILKYKNEKLRIDSNGNLGIGTTSPKANLKLK